MAGWEDIGFLLSGQAGKYYNKQNQTQSDRQQVQQDDLNFRMAQAGYTKDESGNVVTAPGTKAQYDEMQWATLIEQQKQRDIQDLSRDVRDSMVDAWEIKNYDKMAELIHNNPMFMNLMKGVPQELDINNRHHQKALRAAGVDEKTIRAYQKIVERKEQYKKSRGFRSDEGVGPQLEDAHELADAHDKMLDTQFHEKLSKKDQQLFEDIDQLRVAYPVMYNQDGTYQLADMQSMIGMMDLFKGNYNSKVEKMARNNLISANRAMKAISDEQYEAEEALTKNKAYLTGAQARSLEQQNKMVDPFVKDIDSIQKQYAEGKISKDERDSLIGETYDKMQQSRPQQLTAAERREADIIQKENRVREFSGVQEIRDVDVEALKNKAAEGDKEAKDVLSYMQYRASQEKINDQDIKAIGTFNQATSAVDVETFGRRTGILDATVDRFFNAFGINMAPEAASDIANFNNFKNNLAKIMFGSRRTDNDMKRIDETFGKISDADNTALEKMRAGIYSIISQYNELGKKYPYYHAVNIAPLIKNMGEAAQLITNHLEGKGGGKSKTIYTSDVEAKNLPTYTGKNFIDGSNVDIKNPVLDISSVDFNNDVEAENFIMSYNKSNPETKIDQIGMFKGKKVIRFSDGTITPVEELAK